MERKSLPPTFDEELSAGAGGGSLPKTGGSLAGVFSDKVKLLSDPATGQPLTFYRGALNERDLLSSRDNFLHFSKDPKTAAGGERGFIDPTDFPTMPKEIFTVPEGLRVMPAHLAIKNPASMADAQRIAPNARTIRETFPALKSAGFDGYVSDYETIPFDPSQVIPKFGGQR